MNTTLGGFLATVRTDAEYPIAVINSDFSVTEFGGRKSVRKSTRGETLTIQHQTTKENKPYTTLRSTMRLDVPYTDANGNSTVTSVYVVVVAPQGVAGNPPTPVALLSGLIATLADLSLSDVAQVTLSETIGQAFMNGEI
jgi:hypothetical protein